MKIVIQSLPGHEGNNGNYHREITAQLPVHKSWISLSIVEKQYDDGDGSAVSRHISLQAAEELLMALDLLLSQTRNDDAEDYVIVDDPHEDDDYDAFDAYTYEE